MRISAGATGSRRRDDRGAAMVEFAMIGVLLATLLLGIVGFGMLLSVKNSITQAANEGARDAVSVFARDALAYADVNGTVDPTSKIKAEEAALDRMHERLAYLEDDVGGVIEYQCSNSAQCVDVSDNPSITYFARIHDCSITDEAQIRDLGATVDTGDTPDCMYTRVIYDRAGYSVLPALPLIDAMLPATVSDSADVALN